MTPLRFRAQLLAVVAYAVASSSSAASAAGPAAEEPPPQRAPALDAAFGTPPADASVDPTTTADPGYADRVDRGPADQTYGTTARTYDADGNLVDGLRMYEEDLLPPEEGYADEVPEYHVVQQGDTLWDISGYYLHDPYQWPKVWSWNEHITNAHWIFPGDRILLQDPTLRGGRPGDADGDGIPDELDEDANGNGIPDALEDRDGDGVPDDAGLRFSKTGIPETARQESYSLNQIAYVEAEEFETAMTVIGGAEAKVMMATLDTAYMDYNPENPPVIGERLIVYAPREKVYDVKKKKVLGYVVQIMGEIDVTAIARKAAEGVVANALNPVERGYRVGPLRRQFRRIEEVEAERSTTGRIVATLTTTAPIYLERGKKKKPKKRKKRDHHDILVGEEQFVIIDLGEDTGIKVGNVLEVVRKGDEYTEKRVFKIPYEDGWPRRVIGALVVLQVGEETSLAAAVYSAREFERGDHVEMRGRSDANETRQDDVQRRRIDAEAKGKVQTGKGKGKAKAEGSFEIGN